jgi:Ca2+-binding RTX toxin-like protein
MVSYRPWLLHAAATIVVTLAVGAVGTPAQAATTGVAKLDSPSKLSFTAGSGKVNAITVTGSGKVVTFDDKVTIKPGKGCKRVGKDVTKVRCTFTADPAKVLLFTVKVSTGDKNDTITSKADLLVYGYGGTGNDKLTGSKHFDVLSGGAGNDKLYSTGGDDELNGDAGNDLLVGDPGRNYLDGGTGADIMRGGAGEDMVLYRTRTKGVTANLDGLANDGEKGEKDTIATDIENIWSGAGNDRLTGNGKVNTLWAAGGNDIINGEGGDDDLGGYAGNDVINGGAGNDDIHGNEGNDTIRGGDGDDHVLGLSGKDTIYGDSGTDDLTGGDGDDTIRGGDGDDSVWGGHGSDLLHGDAGDDRVMGTYVGGNADTARDVADGGAHDFWGDTCDVGAAGTKLNCER